MLQISFVVLLWLVVALCAAFAFIDGARRGGLFAGVVCAAVAAVAVHLLVALFLCLLWALHYAFGVPA